MGATHKDIVKKCNFHIFIIKTNRNTELQANLASILCSGPIRVALWTPRLWQCINKYIRQINKVKDRILKIMYNKYKNSPHFLLDINKIPRAKNLHYFEPFMNVLNF